MVPGHHVFARANPHVEIGVDPGRGENSVVARDFSGGRGGLARRQRLNIGIVVDSPVKLPQKFAAVAAEIFPRIFSVQNQGNGQRAPDVDSLPDRANALVQILGRRIRIHAAVNEADQVRKIMIAKKSDHFPAAHAHAQRRIQFVRIVRHAGAVAAKPDTQRPPQDSFIRGKPLEPQFGGQGKRFIRYGSFRRPQPVGRLPENTLVVAARPRELFASVFRMAERGRGQRRTRD